MTILTNPGLIKQLGGTTQKNRRYQKEIRQRNGGQTTQLKLPSFFLMRSKHTEHKL
eukprot:m.178556 g.178556  ORF g.178556 m.178556 type:complete len:56 (+) comp15470_c0_seq1:5757-5924(+)